MIFTIVEQISLFIPLLLGAYLSISLMKIPNLSIESAYLSGAIFGSLIILDGYQGIEGLLLTLLASACGGALVGIMTALFSEYAKFSHILSAIITIGFYHGIAQMIIGGSHITLSQEYNPLHSITIIEQYPNLFSTLLIAGITSLLIFVFLKTELGLSCAVYGNNPKFLQHYRINQPYVVITCLALSNALAGISGYLIAQSNGFVDITMGTGLPLLCLSSLIIGKTITPSHQPIQLHVPLIGLAGYFIIQSLLLQVGFDLRYFTAVQAAIIAIILIASSHLSKRSSYQDLLGI